MSVIIKYDSQDIFTSLDIPTPNMSRSSKEVIYGDKKGVVDEFVLGGRISLKDPPVDCDYFSSLTNKRDALMNAFSSDFKKFEVIEDGSVALEKLFSKVVSIDFPDSNNVKVLDYSITLECMDEELHNNFFDVSDPINETSFSLSAGGIYNITRSISAKGRNLQDGQLSGEEVTSKSSSMQGAVDFVKSNSGKENVDLSIIEDGLRLYLKSKSENIDRIKNTFSISEEYIADKNDKSQNAGILEYTVEATEEKGDVHEVNINGTILFGIESDFSLARDRVKSIDFLSMAEESGIQNLVRLPISSSIQEDETSGKISFNLVFNNNTSYDECGIGREYSFSVEESAGKITCSVSGKLTARGPLEKRWELVKEEFESNGKVEILTKAQDNVDQYFGVGNVTLSSVPESKTVVENKQMGEISFDLSFSNKEKLEHFKTFDYNIDMTLPVPNVSVDMNTGGSSDHYFVTRGGFTKPVITINASGEYLNTIGGNSETDKKDQALASIKNKTSIIFLQLENDFSLGGKKKITSNENHGFSKNKNSVTYTKTIEYFGSHVYI
jgi:hypothetical protein